MTGEPDGKTLVEEVVRTKERNQILHFCMDELNSEYRETLYLTYFEGMSYQQAAEVMGKSVKQITNMVYRGKERLRGLLEQEGSQMLSHEERIAEVKRRTAEKRASKKTAAEMDCRRFRRGGVSCGDSWCFPFHARYCGTNRAGDFFRV